MRQMAGSAAQLWATAQGGGATQEQMLNIGADLGSKVFSNMNQKFQGSTGVSQLWLSLKYYFAVDNKFVVRKLRAGRPTSVVAIGSSIATIDYAGCDGGVFNGKEHLIPCRDRKQRVWPGGQPGVGWLRMFGDWLNAVFPVGAVGAVGAGARHRRSGGSNATGGAAAPGKHTIYAMGRTGSGADAFIDCFQTHVKSADLVLLEFAIVGSGSSSFEAMQGFCFDSSCFHVWSLKSD